MWMHMHGKIHLYTFVSLVYNSISRHEGNGVSGRGWKLLPVFFIWEAWQAIKPNYLCIFAEALQQQAYIIGLGRLCSDTLAPLLYA